MFVTKTDNWSPKAEMSHTNNFAPHPYYEGHHYIKLFLCDNISVLITKSNHFKLYGEKNIKYQ
jgi:hypothetical protein